MENKRPQHKWTKEEIEYLKEITPGHHHKEILELMNEKFEYQFGLKQVAGAIRRYGLRTGFTGHFKKGSEPWNKGTKGVMNVAKVMFFTAYDLYNSPETVAKVKAEFDERRGNDFVFVPLIGDRKPPLDYRK